MDSSLVQYHLPFHLALLGFDRSKSRPQFESERSLDYHSTKVVHLWPKRTTGHRGYCVKLQHLSPRNKEKRGRLQV